MKSVKIIEAEYVYRDKDNVPVYKIVRYVGKDFRVFTYLARWVPGLQVSDEQRVIYNLPNVLRSTEKTVVFVEGEKDANILINKGFLATCVPFGAASLNTNILAIQRWLTGRNVVVICDNDIPGVSYGDGVCSALLNHASSVRIIRKIHEKPGGDVADFFGSGGTKDQLLKIIATAELYNSKNDYLNSGKNVYLNSSKKEIYSCGPVIEMCLKAHSITHTSYRFLCPFHADTTPSLFTKESIGVWKCFACGASGDAIEFIRKYLGYGFYLSERLVKLIDMTQHSFSVLDSGSVARWIAFNWGRVLQCTSILKSMELELNKRKLDSLERGKRLDLMDQMRIKLSEYLTHISKSLVDLEVGGVDPCSFQSKELKRFGDQIEFIESLTKSSILDQIKVINNIRKTWNAYQGTEQSKDDIRSHEAD
jgi:hypothetical protein